MNEELKGGIFITTKDIQILNGSTCIRTCQKEHQKVRKELGIKTNRLTIRQYCDFWGLEYDLVINHLKLYRG